MKAGIDCLPCLLGQVARAARAATDETAVHHRVLAAVAQILPTLSLGLSPPEITRQCFDKIVPILDDPDPFRRVK